jgi:hypothetical protein
MIDPKALEAAARAIFNGSAEEWECLPLIHKLVFRSQAKAAITAYLQAREQEGFVEVPREPTEAMLHAAMSRECSGDMYFSIYRAMISAHGGAE